LHGVIHIIRLPAYATTILKLLSNNQGIANSDKAEVILPVRGIYVVTDGKTVVKIVN